MNGIPNDIPNDIPNEFSWYNNVLCYLSIVEIATMSNTCIELYMKSHDNLKTGYREYNKSDLYISKLVTNLNFTGNLIQELNIPCKISTNMMFEYIMLCYENWVILIEHKNKLNVPSNRIFNSFLMEHHLDIDKIIPEFVFQYTHVHRPTKTYAYYKSLV